MKPKAINIREYNQVDFDAVMDIFKRNVPTYFAESEIEDLKRYLQSGIELYFVGEFENKIIGAGGINFDDHNTTGVISWDFVHPAYHGQRIGSRILEYRLNLLRKRENIEKIRVRTSQHTFRYYKKNGFRIQKIVKNYWAMGFDLYDMTLVK